MDQEELKHNLTSGKHWLRLLFMLLYAVILNVAGFVMTVVVVLQFLFSLITGADNRNLRRFGQSLSRFIYQTLRFLTYNTEVKPFPFDDWPSTEDPEAQPAKARPARRSPAKKTSSKTTAKKASAKKTGAATTTATREKAEPSAQDENKPSDQAE